jgi:glycosyltransferase involved in cell wall biosynthesis
VREFEGRLDVTLHEKPNGGLASTRNHGAARARGELLVFLDDDIEPCPEHLAEHLAAHEARDRVVALGSLPHPKDLELTPFLYYLNRVLHYDLFLRYGSIDRIPLPPLNGNSSIRRACFEEAGGYDTSFSRYGGEDTEMGYRLLRRGFTFVYLPRAQGFHYHVKGFDAYTRDMFSSGRAIVAIVRRYPEVRARVNLDIVTASPRDLPPGKLARRALLGALEKAPVLERALERTIARLAPLGLRRLLYPLYLVCGHYHYAAGMRDELGRGPLAPAVGAP